MYSRCEDNKSPLIVSFRIEHPQWDSMYLYRVCLFVLQRGGENSGYSRWR